MESLTSLGLPPDGKTPALGDLMIAAIASTHGLTVATRNVKDFEDLPVKTINPFSPCCQA